MAVDGFFWRPPIAADLVKAETKTDINNFIFAKLNNFWVLPIFLDKPAPILTNKYSDNFQKITTYLLILRRPSEIDIKKFNEFKKKAV